MITGAPHLYRAEGRALGKTDALIDSVLAQARRVEDRGLASVLTLNHLAWNTGASYRYLRRIVQRSHDPYTDIIIRRRDGRKMRAISSPEPVLMEVQRWILHNILENIPSDPASFAYARGSSIKECANRHRGAKWLIKLDIRNFFESIDEARVYSVFRDARYQPLPAFELARVCTRYSMHAKHVDAELFRSKTQYQAIRPYNRQYMGFLPQGAPASGALANLVARSLDSRLNRLAAKHRLVYTRYADDMTFSSGDDFERGRAFHILRIAESAIRNERFVVHDAKTRIVPPGARKIVLGLLVDGEAPRINAATRSRIIHHIRGVEKFGLSQHVTHMDFSSIGGLVRHVSGLISFAADIEPTWADGMRDRWRNALLRNGWSNTEWFSSATSSWSNESTSRR